MHKKGHLEENSRRRNRRVVKGQRGIVGLSLDQLKEKRAVRPEVRKAERDAAVAKAKESKKAKGSKQVSN